MANPRETVLEERDGESPADADRPGNATPSTGRCATSCTTRLSSPERSRRARRHRDGRARCVLRGQDLGEMTGDDDPGFARSWNAICEFDSAPAAVNGVGVGSPDAPASLRRRLHRRGRAAASPVRRAPRRARAASSYSCRDDRLAACGRGALIRRLDRRPACVELPREPALCPGRAAAAAHAVPQRIAMQPPAAVRHTSASSCDAQRSDPRGAGT